MKYKLGTRSVITIGNHYIAPGAVVIGSVELGCNTSVWFNAVLRGDNDLIKVGDGSNIQDGCVLHVDAGFPILIGKNVTIGHKVMLHGCSVGDGSLIGMNAVVLNGASIGKNCLVGAHALVTEGSNIPDNTLVLGSPAKVVKPLSDTMRAELSRAARHYQEKMVMYNHELEVQS